MPSSTHADPAGSLKGSAFLLPCMFVVEVQPLAGPEAGPWQLHYLVCMSWVAINAALC